MPDSQHFKMDWTDTPESKIDIMPDLIPQLLRRRQIFGKRREHRSQDAPGGLSRTMRLMRLTAALVTLVVLLASAASVRAVVMLPGAQVMLSWTSLGSGTTYAVQTSTDLSTWATVIQTAATNVSLSLDGINTCMFRLLAGNAPPQSATLFWDPSVSAPDVAGYYIYYGGATGNYTNRTDVGLATTAVVNGLVAGVTYYFATTAYSSSGDESGYSNEVVWQRLLLLNIQQLP